MGDKVGRLLQIGSALLLFGLLAGCASTGATYGSGVGDTQFSAPPYAAGARPLQGAGIVHVPVTFQRGAVQPELFDVGSAPGTAVAALLSELNGYMARRGLTVAGGMELPGTAPDVRFGCERHPGDECESIDARRPHQLSVGRPSSQWTAAADQLLTTTGAEYVLVITLEVGNYVPRQRNLRGSKEILLGTNHSQDVRWLTALDRPASVLQLTGALVGRDGRARRIAAEGLVAHSTHAVVAGLGAQALITDEDVQRLLTARREDLPGTPPVWQAALENLLVSLTGGS